MIQFNEHKKFQKELNKLTKKHPKLPKSFEVLKSVLKVIPEGNNRNNYKHISTIKNIIFIKVKIGSDIAQRNLFRVIYAYFKERKEILFIELFSKSDQKNHDNKRIEDIKKEWDLKI